MTQVSIPEAYFDYHVPDQTAVLADHDEVTDEEFTKDTKWQLHCDVKAIFLWNKH